MKKCSNCGSENEDTAIICTNCGNFLNANEGQNQQNAQYGSQQNTSGYNPYNAPVASETNGFSIASLIMGILSVLTVWLCCGGVFSILAIVFGFIGKSKVENSGGTQNGRGMALAGIIMGIAAIVIGIIIIAIVIATGSFWQRYAQYYQYYGNYYNK